MVSFRNGQGSRWKRASAPPPCFIEGYSAPPLCEAGSPESPDEDVGDGAAGRPTVGGDAGAARTNRDSGPRLVALGQPAPFLAAFVEALLDDTTDRFTILAEAALAETGDLHRFEDTHLAPAARLLGELWLSDECDFLAVTIAVARLERLFMTIAPRAATAPDGTHRVLLAPAPGNQHSFGLSLVEERFRHAGWTVDCCGIGDGGEMLRLVAAIRYDVIGLSVHSGVILPELTAMIARLRRTSCNRAAVILGGGSLALENARLLLDAGFDHLAEDAASAVRQAEAALMSRTKFPYRAAAE